MVWGGRDVDVGDDGPQADGLPEGVIRPSQSPNVPRPEA